MKIKFGKYRLPSLLLWPFRLIIIGVLIFGLLGVVAYFQKDNIPSITDAPWEARVYSQDGDRQVLSRIYFGKQVLSVNGEPALGGYWSFDGKKYNYIDGVKVFDKKTYGGVSIIRRGM